MALTSLKLQSLLEAWRDLDRSFSEENEVAIAETLTSWAAGKTHLEELPIYYGIDFTA